MFLASTDIFAARSPKNSLVCPDEGNLFQMSRDGGLSLCPTGAVNEGWMFGVKTSFLINIWWWIIFRREIELDSLRLKRNAFCSYFHFYPPIALLLIGTFCEMKEANRTDEITRKLWNLVMWCRFRDFKNMLCFIYAFSDNGEIVFLSLSTVFFRDEQFPITCSFT